MAVIRNVDRLAMEQFNMHSLVLMENAAGACARWLGERYRGPRKAVLLCGRGNNGGDGLAIARHLKVSGWTCQVILLGPLEKLSADTLANWRILTAQTAAGSLIVDPPMETASVKVRTIRDALQHADVIVDAMLGSGASGSPRAPFDQWIEWANSSDGERIAIDIPTGLDAESGAVAATPFIASTTLTFVARKPGFAMPEADRYLGQVEVMPIGIPIELIDQLLDQSVLSGPGGGS